MIILGIETSCDETAIAIVQEGHLILANCLASQVELHALYGGVVPELASRGHAEAIFPLIEQALNQAGLQLEQIDAIAATYTPGLLGALLIGLNVAKSLSLTLKKPFIGVHHIEAHMYAAWMSQSQLNQKRFELANSFPALGLVISGGHTLLCQINQLGSYQLLSHTLDDAMGEAFDKVAVMLGCPYPGGPWIEQLAKSGDPNAYPFKAGLSKTHPWHFSFSGLKTQVLHAIWGSNLAKMSHSKEVADLSNEVKANLAASFQQAMIKDLLYKANYFSDQIQAQSLWIGGGVSANETLRLNFQNFLIPVLWPTKLLSVDNAAMIAGLAYHQLLKAGPSSYSVSAVARHELVNWADD
jgi:N6-L-threonylcarbamoyladenine synthase